MVLTPTAKREQAAAIGDRFERAVSMVFVDFRGIDVELITDLRARFRSAGVDYKVVKNNLVRKALAGSPLGENDVVDQSLRGPTAIAWSYEDPSAAAKVIKAFRKEGDEQEKLVVKLGILEGTILEASRVESELATMPGKDEIRAQLLAQLMAPAQSLVRQLLAPSQNMVHVLDARRRDQEQA
ncbi:MAG: 50S ribosomal protein L10 [Myxococcales bacterium]|nr:50S ribosomal protein L10 [Myxococcales bacterium]